VRSTIGSGLSTDHRPQPSAESNVIAAGADDEQHGPAKAVIEWLP
jgi:hypothetical protein